MTTVISRSFTSNPQRDSSETWRAIVELLSKGKETEARISLLAVTGIASAIITDQAPLQSPIIVTCDGPRIRIYCIYGDDAVDGSDANEDTLSFEPLLTNWAVSLPCPKEDLEWVQNALKKYDSRITARNQESGITLSEESAINEGAFTIDVKGLLNS